MLNHFNNMLRHLFMLEVTRLRPTPEAPPSPQNAVSEEQVRFQPPNDEWRQHVSGLGIRNALNIYLVELRENRKLRSNERACPTKKDRLAKIGHSGNLGRLTYD